MKKYKTFYVTQELYMLKQYLVNQLEITQVVFMKRAIEHYLKVEAPCVDARILITKRTDAQYIKRDKMDSCYFEEEKLVELQKIAELHGCKLSCIIFQVLVSYSALMIPRIKDGEICVSSNIY